MNHPFRFIGFICLACLCCQKEEEPQPGHDYTGTLIMEYSRSFPEFRAQAEMEVTISKTGEVIISSPDQVSYSAEDELEATVRIKEEGNVTVTSLSGKWKVINGEDYLSVNASTLIEGTQTIWGWDDDMGWILAATTPFSVEDPVESPMDFNVAEAVVSYGAVLGSTVPSPYGNVTYKWTLLLVAG